MNRGDGLKYYSNLTSMFGERLHEAYYLHKLNADAEAEEVLNSALSILHQLVLLEDPNLFTILFDVLIQTYYRNSEVASVILRTLVETRLSILGQRHPLPKIASALCRLQSSDSSEAIVQCLRITSDSLKSNLGPMHRVSLFASKNRNISSLGSLGDLLRVCRAELGEHDFRTVQVHLSLIDKLWTEQNYHQAREECYDLLSGIHLIQPPKFTMSFRGNGLYRLAMSHRTLRDDELAVVTIREAIDLRISDRGSWDSTARTWLIRLRSWLMKMGKDEEMEEIRRWYEMIRDAPSQYW